MDIVILIIIIGAVILNILIKKAPQKQDTVEDVNHRADKRHEQTRQNNAAYPKSNRQAQPNYQKPTSSIMDRANLNAAVNLPDELKKRDSHLHQGSGSYIMVSHGLDTEQLMKQVSDLMVCGYSGKLEFERDFIAEGVDMLNKIQG